MKLGIAVTTSVSPALTPTAQADYVSRLAVVAQELGFDSVWVSDRTVYPVDLADRYPDRFGPGLANPQAQNVLEAVTTLSYLAGTVRSIRLGFSVLVLPFRNPVLNAKMMTTLDVLSGGRLILGVGVGWMPEEFAGMGASYPDRGALTDEHLELFKALCTQDPVDFEGQHYQISGMHFFPKPSQQPFPPLWIGGNSSQALHRAVTMGDGWHGIRLSPTELAAKRESLHQLCRQNDRNPAEVIVSLRMTLTLDEAQHSPDGQRQPLTGKLVEIIDDLHRYEAAGLEYLVLSVTGQDTETTVRTIQRFARAWL